MKMNQQQNSKKWETKRSNRTIIQNPRYFRYSFCLLFHFIKIFPFWIKLTRQTSIHILDRICPFTVGLLNSKPISNSPSFPSHMRCHLNGFRKLCMGNWLLFFYFKLISRWIDTSLDKRKRSKFDLLDP